MGVDTGTDRDSRKEGRELKVMPFKYPCFISYPRADSKQGRRIIEQLKETLKNELALLLPEGVFLDVERLKPGFNNSEFRI